MATRSHEDGEEAFTFVNVENPVSQPERISPLSVTDSLRQIKETPGQFLTGLLRLLLKLCFLRRITKRL